MNNRLAVVAALLALSGCISLAPRYERPAIELPPDWAAANGGEDTAALGQDWWKIYDDEELNMLVEEALKNNTDLEIAMARVDFARAQHGLARADRFPSVDAVAERGRTYASLRSGTLPSGAAREFDTYQAGGVVSYEVDLWARFRDASRAARAEVLATEAARETVRIAVVADVVQSYFALRSFDEQLVATQRSIDTRSESLGLQKLRFESGVISEFEYRQLEAETLAARAQLPVIERLRAQQETTLAALLGKTPTDIYRGNVVESLGTEVGEPAVQVAPSGLPSELLLRRPDLVDAEYRLIAANARIGVARSAYFPSISLTGFYGSQSTVLDDLFTGPARTWNAAVSLTQPIFNAGRIGAGVDAANARQREALARYQQAVQNAFRDVRNALIAQAKTRTQFETENERVIALRETLRLARLRYRNGIASQLDVLDAERNLLGAQLNRSDALRAQRAAIADLFKALGGGWGTPPQ
ncbi:MAG TPA: efflux transporter outer membrane subunit [Burkholderiales bacterium]|nr:efflux transporter outer membrane subunit [Burkholderiales bacterium]